MVPGNRQDQTSHRAELAGILLIIKILSMLHREHDLSDTSVEFGLDNDSARKAVVSPWPPSVKQPDYDLIHDARRRMKLLPMTLKSRWIESHQDKHNTDYDSMDIWTLLNIEMDHNAGAYRLDNPNALTDNIRMSTSTTSIRVDGKTLAHFDKNELYTIVHGRHHYNPKDKRTWSCQQFWQAREDIPKECMHRIHWHALGKAYRKYPHGKQRWLVKHATGQCGVGRMHLRHQYQNHSQCPRCGQEDETTKHVLTCKSAATEWDIRIKALSHWLTKSHTNMHLQTAILQRLQEWRRHTPPGKIWGPGTVIAAISRQDKIGWWSFLLGRVDKSFESCMDAHFDSTKIQNKGRPWLSALITQLWDFQFEMWEHRNAAEHTDMSPNQLTQLDLLRTKAISEMETGGCRLLKHDQQLFENLDNIATLY